jgi:glycosyltransferase involved in cell wall biosynthesis
MKLSFVIPAYNEEHYIGACLDAILAQKKVLPYDIEVVVVNNASSDDTEAAIRKYATKDSGVILVNEPKKGITNARRAGFLVATGDLIANVDADTRITPGWIKKVMDEFSKDPKLVGLSGPFIYYDAPRKVRFFTRFFYYIGFGFYLINRFVFRIGSMLQGGNFVVRRDALDKIGGYDTTLSFYGEDTDIARRLNKVGHVKFTFKLPALSSGRRLANEGGLTTGLRYAINYFWITFFKKPFTKDYIDIRLQNKDNVVYAPKDKWKEWAIGTIFVLIIFFIFGGAAYIIYSVVETGTVNTIGFIEMENAARQKAQTIEQKFDELATTTKNMIQDNQ